MGLEDLLHDKLAAITNKINVIEAARRKNIGLPTKATCVELDSICSAPDFLLTNFLDGVQNDRCSTDSVTCNGRAKGVLNCEESPTQINFDTI